MRFLLLFFVALLLAPQPLRAQGSTQNQIAEAYGLWFGGHPQAAIDMLEPLLRSDARVFTGSDLGVALGLLASSYQDMEMYGKARRTYQSAMEALRPIPAAQTQYAATMDNLATLEESLGQPDSAKALCGKAIHIYEDLGDHAGIAIASTDLAVIAYAARDYRASRHSLARAFAEQGALPPDDNNLAAMYSVKAALALRDGQDGEAMSAVQETLVRWTRAHGPDYFMLGTGYLLRAQALARAHDYERALGDARHAMAIAAATIGGNSSAYFTAQSVYADILRTSGAKQEATALKQQATHGLAALQARQCTGCTIDANGFR